MAKIIPLMILIPISILYMGLGIYAWNKKEPMHFWTGTEVKAEEIRDIPAYNRANGIMWIVFSAVFWISSILIFLDSAAGPIFMFAGVLIGIPCLMFVYKKIYSRYKADTDQQD